MKPNFLIIGAAKAATTSLWYLVRQHPEIFMTSRKEPHFFSIDEQYELGFDWYESWFADAEEWQQRGEASASYTAKGFYPKAAERIAVYEPNMRLIFIARHPFDRIESLWLQLRRMSVTKFLQREGMRVDPSFDRALHEQSAALIETTKYWEEISRYRQLFPDEQILVLLFEEFKRDTPATLRRCFEFLGVDPNVEVESPSAHLNSMEQHRLPRESVQKFWGSPRGRALYVGFANLFPHRARKWIGRHLMRSRPQDRPVWTPESKEWVREQLQEDVSKFLDFYGLPDDTWDLSS